MCRRFFAQACALFHSRWQGEAVIQVQVTATHLHNSSGQLELFTADEVRALSRFDAIDRINRKYGEFTVAPATLLDRSSMPNVIAPAWRPDGHTNTFRIESYWSAVIFRIDPIIGQNTARAIERRSCVRTRINRGQRLY